MMEDIIVPCLLGGEWLMKGCGERGGRGGRDETPPRVVRWMFSSVSNVEVLENLVRLILSCRRKVFVTVTDRQRF
jgi:hypothetical protein